MTAFAMGSKCGRAGLLASAMMFASASSGVAQNVTGFAGADYFSKEFLTMGEYAQAYGTTTADAGVLASFANLDVLLSVTLADDDRDAQKIRFDNSKVEYARADWKLGIGQVPRLWSPSRQTSLILGKNSRALPAIYYEVDSETGPDSGWLSWVGPWSFESFLGYMGGAREISNTRLFGARFEVAADRDLSVALSFAGQYGGDGYDSGLGAFWNMLTGDTNADGDDGVPNRLAGFDVSYNLPDKFLPLRVYGQAIGEDEDSQQPSKFMYLAGLEFEGSVGEWPLRLAVEYIDTDIKSCKDCAYNNGAYPSGYTYRGRVLGAAMDTAGEALQFHGELELRNVDVLFTGGYYDVNRTSNPDHRLSSSNVDGYLFAVTSQREMAWGNFQVGLNYQSFDLDNAGIDSGLGLHLGLSARF